MRAPSLEKPRPPREKPKHAQGRGRTTARRAQQAQRGQPRTRSPGRARGGRPARERRRGRGAERAPHQRQRAGGGGEAAAGSQGEGEGSEGRGGSRVEPARGRGARQTRGARSGVRHWVTSGGGRMPVEAAEPEVGSDCGWRASPRCPGGGLPVRSPTELRKSSSSSMGFPAGSKDLLPVRHTNAFQAPWAASEVRWSVLTRCTRAHTFFVRTHTHTLPRNCPAG